MSRVAVIGLGFGDEGKGRTVDHLCSIAEDPIVIRFSGGQQAGHTVVRDGIRHVFSNFGSGTLYGAPTYISQFCTVDPTGIINEMRRLKDDGIIPRLYIDERCPVTTPYEKKINREKDKPNGTVGVGVGPTWEREKNHYSLTFGDLYYPSIMSIKLDMIRRHYNFSMDIDGFIDDINQITGANNIFTSTHIPGNWDDLIFEGSQGLLLDQDIGFFPHVTRSNVGLSNVVKLSPTLDRVYFVTRAYQTRHGNGPMTNESMPHGIMVNPHETNVENIFQGKFRIALLDIDILQYALRRAKQNTQHNKTLVLTCLDHMANDLRFTRNGEIEKFQSEASFIESLSDYLGFDKVLVSRSDSGLFETIHVN
jgi:adenylosuccinate synthase